MCLTRPVDLIIYTHTYMNTCTASQSKAMQCNNLDIVLWIKVTGIPNGISTLLLLLLLEWLVCSSLSYIFFLSLLLPLHHIISPLLLHKLSILSFFLSPPLEVSWDRDARKQPHNPPVHQEISVPRTWRYNKHSTCSLYHIAYFNIQ